MEKILNISEKINIIRKKEKKTQGEFAQLLNIGISSIKRYEKGDRVPDYLFLEKLVKQFNINPMWLFFDDENIKLDKEDRLNFSKYNQNILKDLKLIMNTEELRDELNAVFIRKIVEKFIISDKEKSPIYRFLEAVKLEGHMPARPFLFLYYIFTFIAQDEEKESITSYRQYLIDVMSSYKTLSWHNNPVFTNKIKDEISARFELDVSEDECKTLVQNAEITLEKLEEKMPASMIKYHRNIKLKSLFPDKF